MKENKQYKSVVVISRLITKPVIVNIFDQVVDCIYIICAFLTIIPLLCSVIMLNTPLFYYMSNQDFLEIFLIMIGSISVEILLWLVRNYILNYDID